jgi:hypothetical protein
MNLIEPIIDAVVASCFLFAAIFYLMVGYGERQGVVWKIFGCTGAIWFGILFVKLISNIAGWNWLYGIVRSTIAISLLIYLYGLVLLARMMK